MYFGDIEIAEWKVNAMCYNLGRMFLEDMQDPEKRAAIMAKAEEIRIERERKAKA